MRASRRSSQSVRALAIYPGRAASTLCAGEPLAHAALHVWRTSLGRADNSSGFQVIAFPCNQFGAQAPCSSDCERAYLFHKMGLPVGAFPVFDKGIANGPGSLEPLIVAKQRSKGHDTGFDIAWNYEKFIADGDGKPVARFASSDDPLKAEPVIRSLLGLHPLA